MEESSANEFPTVSFKYFIWGDRRNKSIIKIALVVIIVQFTIFKYFYPYISYIHGDSFSYLEAAESNLDVSTYMIGYSKFLRLFSVFTKSDLVLSAFQYIFIELSAIFLLFSIVYFLRPKLITQYILFCLVICNPLFLHLANLVSSDSIFASLSLLWFGLLLWLIYKPSNSIIIWHIAVIFISFTVRYNALIYPLIGGIAFYMAKTKLSNKIIGFAGGVLVCGLFMIYTANKYYRLTGYWQYSPFSGWQLANNAMYAYRYVAPKDRKPVPNKFQRLDKMIRAFFDSTRDVNKFPWEAEMASTYYMWSPQMPLMSYKDSIIQKDTTISDLKGWASMGPFYKSYGIYIIKRYPSYFLRYFLWPNANKYYAVPIEFLISYNSGKNYVTPQAKSWFEYKSQTVKTRMKSKRVHMLDFYPILSGIMNILMLCILLFYLYMRGWQYSRTFAKGVILFCSIWIANATFTIFASSPALRFQTFPIILMITFTILMMDFMVQIMPKVNELDLYSEDKKDRVTGQLSSN